MFLNLSDSLIFKYQILVTGNFDLNRFLLTFKNCLINGKIARSTSLILSFIDLIIIQLYICYRLTGVRMICTNEI